MKMWRKNRPPSPGGPPLLTRDHVEAIRRSLPLTPEESLYAMALASHIMTQLIRQLDKPMRRARHDETRLGWERMKQRMECHRRRLHRQMRRMGEPEVQIRLTPLQVREVSWSHLFALLERLIEGTKDIRLKAVLREIWAETAIHHSWLASWAVHVGDLTPDLIQ